MMNVQFDELDLSVEKFAASIEVLKDDEGSVDGYVSSLNMSMP